MSKSNSPDESAVASSLGPRTLALAQRAAAASGLTLSEWLERAIRARLGEGKKPPRIADPARARPADRPALIRDFPDRDFPHPSADASTTRAVLARFAARAAAEVEIEFAPPPAALPQARRPRTSPALWAAMGLLAVVEIAALTKPGVAETRTHFQQRR